MQKYATQIDIYEPPYFIGDAMSEGVYRPVLDYNPLNMEVIQMQHGQPDDKSWKPNSGGNKNLLENVVEAVVGLPIIVIGALLSGDKPKPKPPKK